MSPNHPKFAFSPPQSGEKVAEGRMRGMQEAAEIRQP